MKIKNDYKPKHYIKFGLLKSNEIFRYKEEIYQRIYGMPYSLGACRLSPPHEGIVEVDFFRDETKVELLPNATLYLEG